MYMVMQFSDVAKRDTVHENCNSYTIFFSEHDPELGAKFSGYIHDVFVVVL